MGTVYPLWRIMPTHFVPHNRASYYYRVTIPRSLLPYFRRGQIWRSLRTNNRDQATLRSAKWTAHLQELFILLKRKGAHMTSSDIDTLVERWLSSEVEFLEDNLADFRVTDEWLEGAELVWDSQHESLH